MTRYVALDEMAQELKVDKVVVDDDDLVTLQAASTVLGYNSKYLHIILGREAKPGATRTLPEPRVAGEKVRLWSMRELKDWHAARSA